VVGEIIITSGIFSPKNQCFYYLLLTKNIF
jgi:hypothetical protein